MSYEKQTLEEASIAYCNTSYIWPVNKQGELVTMPPGQSVPPGFTKHSKLVSKAFIAGATWQKEQAYTVKEVDWNENISPEEEVLETIKFVLQAGNDAQAIRVLEQFGAFRKEGLYSKEEIRGIIISFWEQFPDKWDIDSWIDEKLKK